MNIVAVREKPQMMQLNALQSQVIKFRTQDEDYKYHAAQTGPSPAVIRVVSAGGGGTNALNLMIERGLQGVDFIAVNTDVQHLQIKSKATVKLPIGSKVTGGLGAGGNPEKGEKAAIEDVEAITEVLRDSDMVFITAGMGGGTGTGSAPVIANIAREMGALTVAVVTTPFEFEGRYKMKVALDGIAKLRQAVDTIIIIPNQYLFKLIDNTTNLINAYQKSDEVLCNNVQGISELITHTGIMNIDFADVEAIMKGMGDALMGIGVGTGENRALSAVSNAIDNPLLEDTSIDGATGVLINITGPADIKLAEIQSMVDTIRSKCDPEVNLKYGLNIDPEMENCIKLMVIATGFHAVQSAAANKGGDKKSKGSDFIDYSDFVKMRERTKRPEYLSCLPPKDYQDDLDVPSVIRNHSYADETSGLGMAENG
uniref:Cell division protein FtsZ n=1 Tax=uncultured bacterium contig00015 TaxID=1181506 RepID=A0A806K347_9BACT|nr:cell division protein FtsZ [uncultured bacterium contig00015]